MSLKDLFGKAFKKSETVEIAPENETDVVPLASEAFPVVKLSEDELSIYEKLPLASLNALGTAFTRLSDDARTITTTVTKNIVADGPLFVGINPKGISGEYQRGAFGINGNIMRKNAQGKKVIVDRMQFREAEPLFSTETTKTVMPLDPTLMIVAVALMTIEQKLDGIQRSVEEILQFLKQEKQSRQRGNLNMLAEIMDDLKINCQNDQFCTSRANQALSIKTQAYQDIDFYQNQIQAELQKQKSLHGSKNAQGVLDAVTYQFAEYQLACHIFAFSSFLDVMLRKNFDAEFIERETKKILEMAKRYEALYADCHERVSKYQRSAIETKLLDGIGIAAQGLGKAIGSVPVIKDGSLDETLISAGESIGRHNQEALKKKLANFELLESDRINPFADNLQRVSLLYNSQNAMLTDGENLYIAQSTQNNG